MTTHPQSELRLICIVAVLSLFLLLTAVPSGPPITDKAAAVEIEHV